MKKEIPSWAMISAVVVAVLVCGFFIYRASQGPGDLPAPKITIKEEVPSHLQGKLTPEMEKMMREQAKQYGTMDPNAKSDPVPVAPPSGQ